MASPIEQLVSNFSISQLWRNKTLKRSLGFLLLAFVAMRLGSFIPLPGVNSEAWASSPFAHLGSLFY